MRRTLFLLPAGLLLAAGLGGCAAIVATATVASAVAATTVTTAGKVTVATVKTSGKVVTSAVTSSGDVTALTIESAAKLARTGMVVAVDSSTGVMRELPWEEGMRLYALTQGADFEGAAAAHVFRMGRRLDVDLRKADRAARDLRLESGDVVEFVRRGRRA